MNKQDLIKKVAADEMVSLAKAELIIDSIFWHISHAVHTGEDFKLVGFGTFTKAKHKARMGHNPQNGEKIRIPARWVPKFRPHKSFKDELN